MPAARPEKPVIVQDLKAGMSVVDAYRKWNPICGIPEITIRSWHSKLGALPSPVVFPKNCIKLAPTTIPQTVLPKSKMEKVDDFVSMALAEITSPHRLADTPLKDIIDGVCKLLVAFKAETEPKLDQIDPSDEEAVTALLKSFPAELLRKAVS